MLMSEASADRLRSLFADSLEGPVEIALSPPEEGGGGSAGALLREIVDLSPKLSLATLARREANAPSIALVGAAKGVVRFAGLPTGYELPVLVDAIVDVSRGATALAEATRSRLAALGSSRHVRVYTTPT